ncbi:hypothetical protein, partial [Yoonia sp.]|uniref:hypothetical protein n=1 Tax=Yoonia sp. TaxID=2212373 RepID=UPI002E054775|nr:hypothetical protein [Yoonia sp.]
LIPGGQSSLLRAGGRAAAEGAAYAFGTGEGGLQERLARVPAGAALGGGAGVAGYGAAKALGGLTNRLVDSARRTVGGRGSTVVENEIQRLVAQTGKTPDEITQDIIEGRLLAENKTIQAAVRALRTQGGEASTIIQQGMVGRPAQTRAAAMAEMRQYLGDAGAGSQAAARRASEEATVAAERAAYAPFARQVAPDEVVEGLADTLRRVPSAAKEVEMQLRAETGSAPFFKVTEEGAVEFTRAPTVAEAESIRRAVQNRASTLYREGMGGAGGAVRGAEQELRGLLDMSIPELATTRAQAAAVRANRDAYEAGQKALAGDVNEKLVDFAKLSQGQNSDEAVAAFRAGLMQALEARAATGSRQSMIRNLANAETKEGRVLREVFPQDQLDDVLKSIDIASDAQEAASKILIGTGSQTTETALEAGRQGLGLSAEEVSAVLGGSPVETLNVASKIMKRLVRTELTDAERARIAEILVSTDPQIVRNAIIDESGMQRLADAVNQIMTGAQNVARGTAATQAGAAGGEAMPMQGLLAQ